MLGILLPLYIFQLALPPGKALLPAFSGIQRSSDISLASSVSVAPLTSQTSPAAPAAQPAATPQEVPSPGTGQPGGSAATTEAEASPKTSTENSKPSSSANFVSGLVQAVNSGNWQDVDKLVALNKASSQPPERGDRKAARAANTQGLAFLGRQEYEAAITAFSDGVKADPSDVEVLNNLGFAYLASNRSTDGIKTLVDLLSATPDRSSAWANLSEGLSQISNENGSLGALRLAVRFSANRDRTTEYLKRISTTHSQPIYRSVAARVLGELSSIPASSVKIDSALAANGNPANQQQGGSATTNSQTELISTFLNDAETALTQLKFDAAKTYVESVRRIDPGNPQAVLMTQRIAERERRYLREETTIK
jgi:tetratricopeptide (TPR) repeat protein